MNRDGLPVVRVHLEQLRPEGTARLLGELTVESERGIPSSVLPGDATSTRLVLNDILGKDPGQGFDVSLVERLVAAAHERLVRMLSHSDLLIAL